jgi:hypothetical protein
MKDEQIVIDVLKNFGKTDAELADKITVSNLKESLTNLKLASINERNLFYWNLHVEAERTLVLHPDALATAIPPLIADAWNSQKHLPMVSAEVALSFLTLVRLGTQTEQDAFRSICKGNISEKHKALCIDLFVRYAICHNTTYDNFIERSANNLQIVFPIGVTNQDVQDSIRRLDFIKRNRNQLFEPKLHAYKRLIGIEKLVFNDGLAQLFPLDNIAQNSSGNHESLVKYIDFDYTKRLEDEVDRLSKALQTEREYTTIAVEKTLVQLLSSIGGKDCNYLLSDLYEESEGHLPDSRMISQGRLINLFSALSLIGIEPFTGFRELNTTYQLHKDELIKSYMLDKPIQTQNEQIPFKITRYGWQYNGKVVIPPLATEMKEEFN